MKRSLAYITAAWRGDPAVDMEQAAHYCRVVYDAGYSPICPMLYLPLFLNDAVPEEHKNGIDMGRDLLRRSRVLVMCGHMENSSVPRAARRTACAFQGMYSRSPLSSAPSTPRRSRWPCASISSRPTPAPASWWRTSARAPAQRRWPPSTRAAASSVLKPSQPTMPPPASASAWRARRWRLGRKEFDYRTVFCDLRRSPLAVFCKECSGCGGKALPHNGD